MLSLPLWGGLGWASLIPCTLGLVLLTTACHEDESVTDYLDSFEAGELTVETDTVKTKNQYALARLNPGDHVDFYVNVKYNKPENLKYRWYVLKTYYNSYQPEQVGNVMQYPPADTIAYTKDLEWDVDLKPGTYFFYLQVEDPTTGMKVHYRPYGSYSVVEQSGNQGGLYLLVERDGGTDIEIFTSALMLIYGGQAEYKQYYSQLAGSLLEGKPRWIRTCTTGKNAKDGYMVCTDKNLYRLNSVGLQIMNTWEDSFYETPETFDPQAFIYTNSYGYCEFLVNDGKVHVMYTNKANDRKFSAPLAGDYYADTYLMPAAYTTWRPASDAINARQVFYDKQARQFRPYFDKGTSLSFFKSTNGDAYADANKLPADPMVVFNNGAYESGAIINDNGTPKLYRFLFYNVPDDGDLSADGDRSIVDLSGCEDILNAKHFTASNSGYAFFYATDNAVRSFSTSSGQTTSKTIYTCEAGEVVTAIYNWGNGGGGFPTSSCGLWIATWNESTKNGRLIQYEIDNNYGEAVDFWGPMFGAAPGVLITDGWGKIVSMICIGTD